MKDHHTPHRQTWLKDLQKDPAEPIHNLVIALGIMDIIAAVLFTLAFLVALFL
jgi:hypothetical protein